MRGEQEISLLICDEQGFLLDALAMIVKRSDGISLVAEPAEDPGDAIAICEEEHPDVVLMGIQLDSQPGAIEATRRIKASFPSTKVIVMSARLSDDRILEAIEAGADAFVSKSERVDRLFDLIKLAANGGQLIDSRALPQLLQRASLLRRAKQEIDRRMARLTEREREVLALLALGLRNVAIATRLVISERTVETHVQNVLRKLEVHSKLEAVALFNGKAPLSEVS